VTSGSAILDSFYSYLRASVQPINMSQVHRSMRRWEYIRQELLTNEAFCGFTTVLLLEIRDSIDGWLDLGVKA
jgi:hypothetical protein